MTREEKQIYNKQYNVENKDKRKEYRENNKDEIKQYDKQYRENNKEKIKQYRENNKEKMKEYDKNYREINKDKLRQYAKNNAEKARLKARNWRVANPDRVRNNFYVKHYGITLEQYNQMFTNQSGNCAICGRNQSEFKKALFIDHCHNTGKVRGLLCAECNFGLSKFQDQSNIVYKAGDYLKKYE